jgi:hypothetical protein
LNGRNKKLNKKTKKMARIGTIKGQEENLEVTSLFQKSK